MVLSLAFQVKWCSWRQVRDLKTEECRILLQRCNVEVHGCLTTLHHLMPRHPNVETSPGAVCQIFRITAKIIEKNDKMYGCEQVKRRIETELLGFLYSFPYFLVLICMDSKNIMYYPFSIMN